MRLRVVLSEFKKHFEKLKKNVYIMKENNRKLNYCISVYLCVYSYITLSRFKKISMIYLSKKPRCGT